MTFDRCMQSMIQVGPYVASSTSLTDRISHKLFLSSTAKSMVLVKLPEHGDMAGLGS